MAVNYHCKKFCKISPQEGANGSMQGNTEKEKKASKKTLKRNEERQDINTKDICSNDICFLP
jgi:hypothetical protein